jgi:uncharacterized protein
LIGPDRVAKDSTVSRFRATREPAVTTAPAQNQDTHRVIDGHVHVFPADVCRERDRYCAADPWFGALYASPRAKLVDFEALQDSMTAAGVTASVLCGFPWADAGLCQIHNDYMAECTRSNPDAGAWLATVVPGHPDAVREAERCFDAGAAGIGELNADAQGFDLREPERFDGLVRLCEERSKPVMFHVSEPVGHNYPGKGTSTPDRLLRFLQRFPNVRVVAAHWGGGMPFYELMPEVAILARNVSYDSAASTYLYRPSVFPAVIDLVGSERVIFGSDFPVLRQDRFLRRLRLLGLAPSTLRRVLSDNARDLFQIGSKETGGD